MVLILSCTIPKAGKELCFLMFPVSFCDFQPVCFQNLPCILSFTAAFCTHLCCVLSDDSSHFLQENPHIQWPNPNITAIFYVNCFTVFANRNGSLHCLLIIFAFLNRIHLAVPLTAH